MRHAAVPGLMAAFLLASTAQAQSLLPTDFYAGADFQYTTVTWNDLALPTTPPSSVNGSDLFADTFPGANFHVGARLTPHIGVELGYVWLPEREKDIGGGAHSSLSVRGAQLDGLVYWPIAPRIEVVGLLGVAFLEGTAELTSPVLGTVHDVDPDWSGRFGGGLQFLITDRVNVRGLVTYQNASFDGEVDHAFNFALGLNVFLN